MSISRRQIIDLVEQGCIPQEKIETALKIVRITPDGKSWRTFIESLLLWLGGLALVFALMFFIAYNWTDLGRLVKFVMVQVALVIAIGTYCKLTVNTIASRVSILMAVITLGVLLALFGQTYQTGADPWQLFFNWALLMLPWAIIGRFPVIWIVWITLINIAITLYQKTFGEIFGFVFYSYSDMLWIAFLVNTLFFIAWQLLAKIWKWLNESWAIRLLALGSGVPVTWLVLASIFDYQNTGFYPVLGWVVWLAAMYFVYRKVHVDLFMLTGCCLSVITITITFLAKYMLDLGGVSAFLFLSFVLIIMSGGAAFWLNYVHQESRT